MTSRRSAVKSLVALLAAACDSTIARLKGRTVVAIARLDEVPRDSAFRKTVGDQPYIVVNDKGDVRTFLAVCTHEGCPLGWNPTQHLIRCPCHGSAFDMRGRVVQGPAKDPLTEVQTFVERGTVSIVSS